MTKEVVFLKHIEDYTYINSYDGQVLSDSVLQRFEKKNNVVVVRKALKDDTCYKYDVTTYGNSVFLNVYSGKFVENEKTNWIKVYSAEANIDYIGIKEEGDLDLSFWHEYFGTGLGTDGYYENRVEYYGDGDCMKELRKVFLMELQPNPFLFFEKYKTLKKYQKRKFDISIFDIPMQKLTYRVGKEYSGRNINYVFQHEVELGGEVFFDLKVVYGFVEDGIIKPETMCRIFLTSGYWYSPNGGDIGILVDVNTFGEFRNHKMKTRHPEFMINKYKGKYIYQYILSRGFIPCFEILAKAGYQELADMMLDTYYDDFYAVDNWGHRKAHFDFRWNTINIFGKNDREIFGFKMSKFKNISVDAYSAADKGNYHWNKKVNFLSFIFAVRNVIAHNNTVFDIYKIGYELFDFLINSPDISFKTIDYVRGIGIEKAQMYIDYLGMCRATGKWSGGVYPKRLKYEHDVMAVYTNQLKEIKNNTSFKNIVKMPSYQELIYDGEKEDIFCILAPRQAEDLANEGLALHHCVKGYVGLVANGSTKIYFMREKERKSKSLVTLEVRGNFIRQARGMCNRKVSNNEFAFISKWADKKGIICDFN